MVTDPERQPVGLLFAGNADGTFAIANPVDLVLNTFDVSVDDGSAEPTPTPTPDPDATPTPEPTPEPTPTATPIPPPSAGDMGVYEISWNSKKKNLQFTVNIRRDSDGVSGLSDADSPAETARVNATLTLDSDADGNFECGGDDQCWANFGGDTDTNGGVKFSLVGGAPMGLYQAEVTGLTHANFVWNTALDVDNPDTFDRR